MGLLQLAGRGSWDSVTARRVASALDRLTTFSLIAGQEGYRFAPIPCHLLQPLSTLPTPSPSVAVVRFGGHSRAVLVCSYCATCCCQASCSMHNSSGLDIRCACRIIYTLVHSTTYNATFLRLKIFEDLQK